MEEDIPYSYVEMLGEGKYAFHKCKQEDLKKIGPKITMKVLDLSYSYIENLVGLAFQPHINHIRLVNSCLSSLRGFRAVRNISRLDIRGTSLSRRKNIKLTCAIAFKRLVVMDGIQIPESLRRKANAYPPRAIDLIFAGWIATFPVPSPSRFEELEYEYGIKEFNNDNVFSFRLPSNFLDMNSRTIDHLRRQLDSGISEDFTELKENIADVSTKTDIAVGASGETEEKSTLATKVAALLLQHGFDLIGTEPGNILSSLSDIFRQYKQKTNPPMETVEDVENSLLNERKRDLMNDRDADIVLPENPLVRRADQEAYSNAVLKSADPRFTGSPIVEDNTPLPTLIDHMGSSFTNITASATNSVIEKSFASGFVNEFSADHLSSESSQDSAKTNDSFDDKNPGLTKMIDNILKDSSDEESSEHIVLRDRTRRGDLYENSEASTPNRPSRFERRKNGDSSSSTNEPKRYRSDEFSHESEDSVADYSSHEGYTKSEKKSANSSSAFRVLDIVSPILRDKSSSSSTGPREFSSRRSGTGSGRGSVERTSDNESPNSSRELMNRHISADKDYNIGSDESPVKLVKDLQNNSSPFNESHKRDPLPGKPDDEILTKRQPLSRILENEPLLSMYADTKESDRSLGRESRLKRSNGSSRRSSNSKKSDGSSKRVSNSKKSDESSRRSHNSRKSDRSSKRNSSPKKSDDSSRASSNSKRSGRSSRRGSDEKNSDSGSSRRNSGSKECDETLTSKESPNYNDLGLETPEEALNRLNHEIDTESYKYTDDDGLLRSSSPGAKPFFKTVTSNVAPTEQPFVSKGDSAYSSATMRSYSPKETHDILSRGLNAYKDVELASKIYSVSNEIGSPQSGKSSNTLEEKLRRVSRSRDVDSLSPPKDYNEEKPSPAFDLKGSKNTTDSDYMSSQDGGPKKLTEVREVNILNPPRERRYSTSIENQIASGERNVSEARDINSGITQESAAAEFRRYSMVRDMSPSEFRKFSSSSENSTEYRRFSNPRESQFGIGFKKFSSSSDVGETDSEGLKKPYNSAQFTSSTPNVSFKRFVNTREAPSSTGFKRFSSFRDFGSSEESLSGPAGLYRKLSNSGQIKRRPGGRDYLSDPIGVSSGSLQEKDEDEDKLADAPNAGEPKSDEPKGEDLNRSSDSLDVSYPSVPSGASPFPADIEKVSTDGTSADTNGGDSTDANISKQGSSTPPLRFSTADTTDNTPFLFSPNPKVEANASDMMARQLLDESITKQKLIAEEEEDSADFSDFLNKIKQRRSSQDLKIENSKN